jgi:hypothetical protein
MTSVSNNVPIHRALPTLRGTKYIPQAHTWRACECATRYASQNFNMNCSFLEQGLAEHRTAWRAICTSPFLEFQKNQMISWEKKPRLINRLRLRAWFMEK